MARGNKAYVYNSIVQDIAIVAMSVIVSILLVRSGIIQDFLASSQELGHIGSFVAGIFFTSIFTTAPAIVTLGEISQVQGIVETALWASLGAVIGDMLIFRFFKDRMADHVNDILSHKRSFRRLHRLIRFRFFRYLTFLMGGLIIASPLPDELGISILGMSKMREMYFVPLSFAFNFFGIVVVGLLASSV